MKENLYSRFRTSDNAAGVAQCRSVTRKREKNPKVEIDVDSFMMLDLKKFSHLQIKYYRKIVSSREKKFAERMTSN